MRKHYFRWRLGGIRLVGMLVIGLLLPISAAIAAHEFPPITTEAHGWVELGDGMDGDVTALSVGVDGSIYVGGKFTAVGPMAATNIARWNPRHGWDALGGGVSHPPPAEAHVATLAVHPNGDLYVGGWFATAGGIAAPNVARWTGTAWEAIGSGPVVIQDRVTMLLVGQDGNLYVRGRFATIGGVAAANIARWDQTTWHALGWGGDTNPPGPMVMTDDGILHVASGERVRTWDGSVWGYGAMVQGPPLSLPTVVTMLKDPMGARGTHGRYIGGTFTAIDGVTANSIARGTDGYWRGLGTGVQGTITHMAFGRDGMLYVTGTFALDGDDRRPRIARWNGTTWTDLGLDTSCIGPIGIGIDGSLYTIRCRPLATGVRGSFLVRWDTTSK